MEKNQVRDCVVPASVSLEDLEGYCVREDGTRTTALGQMCKGVVIAGRAAGLASEVVICGRVPAYVDGTVSSVTANDPLCVNGTASGTGTASANGVLSKATVGTHHVRAVALEATSTLKLIDVLLLRS